MPPPPPAARTLVLTVKRGTLRGGGTANLPTPASSAPASVDAPRAPAAPLHAAGGLLRAPAASLAPAFGLQQDADGGGDAAGGGSAVAGPAKRRRLMLDDALDTDGAVPAQTAGTSGSAPPAGGAGAAVPEAEDDLDQFMSVLANQNDIAKMVKTAAAARPPVVTLEDIMSGAAAGTPSQAAPTRSVAASSTVVAAAHSRSSAAREGGGMEAEDDDAEAAYHEQFMQRLRGNQGVASRDGALNAAPTAASDGSAQVSHPISAPVPAAPVPVAAPEHVSGASGTASTDPGSRGGVAPPTTALALPARAAGGGDDVFDDIEYDRGEPATTPTGTVGQGVDGDAAGEAEDEEDKLYKGEEWAVGGKSALELLKEKLAKKELRAVDHGGVEYIPFRKAFYIEPRSIAALAPLEVAAIRDSLGIKLRGRGVPKPLETWDQTGLPSRLLQSLQERQFAAPFAIQRQALPIIMSGRDVIGIAKTGSGKTLAYLLPMFRQILDQPPLNDGDGPIGLILAPARELVTQIYHEARKFAKPLGLRVAAVYGGAQVSEQIADLKRRAEVVVATPGRLIDILTMNSGRVISLSRVTYVVLDEADRMFDMGFEPQITRILNTVRPDRQTVLFSATFPLHVEMLAKSALTNPIELVVGGRSTASADVTQLVEVHTESEKFPRLLQLLGHWYERGNVLIFVDTKEHCDQLYLDLMKFGYPAVSLHGGKDQTERDETIADFKSKVATIMVATSVAGRGLDVKDLVLVVNYSCPDHLEDYVHRVGRTGRAGRKGTAYTFITPEEGKYADDLIRALTDAKQSQRVTPELAALAAEHHRKVAAGEARKRASGFTRTKGFKFDATEMSATQASRDAHRRAYELQAGIKDISEILAEEEERRLEVEELAATAEAARDVDIAAASAAANAEAAQAAEAAEAGGSGEPAAPSAAGAGSPSTAPAPAPAPAPEIPSEATLARLRARLIAKRAALDALSAQSSADGDSAEVQSMRQEVSSLAAQVAVMSAKLAAKSAAAAGAPATPGKATPAPAPVAATPKDAMSAALAAAAAIQQKLGAAGLVAHAGDAPQEINKEVEINDYPQRARSRVMRREFLGQVQDATHTTITVRGLHVDATRRLPPGERKLYLNIEGRSEASVRRALNEIRSVLEEETLRATASLDKMGSSAAYAKY